MTIQRKIFRDEGSEIILFCASSFLTKACDNPVPKVRHLPNRRVVLFETWFHQLCSSWNSVYCVLLRHILCMSCSYNYFEVTVLCKVNKNKWYHIRPVLYRYYTYRFGLRCFFLSFHLCACVFSFQFLFTSTIF